MQTRGLHDKNGELFGFLEGSILYTLEGEATGRLENEYIVDMAGNRIWRVSGDGLYSLDTGETIGYLSTSSPDVR